MRKPEALTVREVTVANAHRPYVLGLIGKTATVEFTKRDGSERVETGTIVSLTGQGDKEQVIIETDKGFKSANLYRVSKIS